MRKSVYCKVRSGQVSGVFAGRLASRKIAWPGGRMCATGLCLWVVLTISAGVARAQGTNQITAVNPNTAMQGISGLAVTFTLDTDNPPAPPANILPTSLTIGSISGSSITHSSQYTVTAVFSIPAGESVGAKDVTITFSTPNGTVVFSKIGSFTVTAGANTAASITQQPQSATVVLGGSVSFTVAASGTAPLRYQWRKDASDISGATSESYTISGVAAADAGGYRCVVTNDYGSAMSDAAVLTVSTPSADGFPVVDTGQVQCYNAATAIAAPTPGQAFYGQDAQIAGNLPSYTLSTDGLTVYDNVTGLTWQRSPDTNGDGLINASDKMAWTQAQAWPAALNAAHYGGYSDWRLPSIKEMYSLFNGSGGDPSTMTGTDTSMLTPFIDTRYFRFGYGDTSAGERVIDAQYASSTLYVAPIQPSEGGKLFGVNLADGRIKGYGLIVNNSSKTFYVQCVRGNTHYGVNQFVDNGDGTITDRATGLMWAQSDSGTGMTWENALAWAQTRNAANYLGHNDWRLPDTKELQSIVDYTRCPDSTGSAAIDPLFSCTPITNENYQADYPWYWTSTTHATYNGSGTTACYVTFGRALGYMNGAWVDIHGAGCQRSDPKAGSLSGYGHAGNGYYNAMAPQGDAVRMFNYVRLVRDAKLVGDIDGDGRVDVVDLLYFVDAFGSIAGDGNYDARSDFNSDSLVDAADLLMLVENFGK